MRGRELAEEAVEAAGHREEEESSLARGYPAVRVRDAAWCEHEATWTHAKCLFSDLELVLAFEDVEELVLALVDVKRCVEEGWDLLEEVESAAARGGPDADEDRRVAEDQTLPFAGSERMCRKVAGHVPTIYVSRRVSAIAGRVCGQAGFLHFDEVTPGVGPGAVHVGEAVLARELP
jgi:hypothetical protein